MPFNAVTIERRIKTLERARRDEEAPRIHETETVSPTGDSSADFVHTHSSAEDNAVFVVPLRLSGVIQVRQASIAVFAAAERSAQRFALAIYKYNFGPLDRDSPLTEKPFQLRLVAKFGSGLGPAGSASATRLNLSVDREIILNPRTGEFFVAYQTTQYGKLLCPGVSLGAYASRRGRKTSYLGSEVGDMPDILSVSPKTASVPWVALRSTLGMRLYGDVETYK